LAATAIPTDVIDVIVAEMAMGVERAVEFWMSQIEQALTDGRLTTLGRLNAVRSIVEEYKCSTGKTQLVSRGTC